MFDFSPVLRSLEKIFETYPVINTGLTLVCWWFLEPRRSHLGGYALNLPVHEHQVVSQQSAATFRPEHFHQTPRVQSGIHVESVSQLVHRLRKRKRKKSYRS